MKVYAWRAWYTQDRVYRSSVDAWEDLPKEGILLLCIFFDEFSSRGIRYKEIIHGKRRYFKSIGSSGSEFYKGSLWREDKLLATYKTKPEWIKEGIYDDDETITFIIKEALEARHG